MSISVKVSYNSSLHRFTLPRNPTFLTLCEALIKTLHLPISPKVLSNATHTPITLWFLDDEADYCRLFDDLSLREALRLSPRLLRLLIRPATSSPSEHPEFDTLPIIASAATIHNQSLSSSPPQFSTSTLQKLLSHLKKHAYHHAKDALDTLYHLVRRNDRDFSAIRHVRHDLASLFSNFLAKQLGPTTRGKIPTEASDALQKALRDLLTDADVSRATIEAAVRAVRAVCACRVDCDVLRERYSDIVQDLARRKEERIKEDERDKVGDKQREEEKRDIVRPVKHYMNLFVKLMRVAGKDAQDAYETFAVAKREAEERGSKFEVSRHLCKGIQRAGFHFLRCHVKEGREFEIETRAVKSLAKAVRRKLKRVGYDETVVECAQDLVEAMAMDREVLILAFEWANKPERPVKEPVDDDRDLPEIGREDKEWGDWHDMVQKSGSRKKKKKPQQRNTRRFSNLRSNWRHESSSSSSSRSSRSSSSESDRGRHGRRSSFQDRLRKWRRMGGGDHSDSSSSSSTIRSMREEEWNQYYGRYRKGGHYRNAISPMHSSEERWRRQGSKNYNSDAQESADTQESQWARVQMDKEKEMEAKRARQMRLARERQMERERMMDIQLAREREQELQEEQGSDAWRYGSRRRSYGYSRRDYPSRQWPSSSRRGSHYTQTPHRGHQRWNQDFLPRGASEGPRGYAEERREEPIPERNSRRRSFRSLGERARDSFMSREGGFADRFEQRRGGSLPPGWNGGEQFPETGGQDWGAA